MSKLLISLGVFSGSGGPTKTIGSFKRALDAELFCFCSGAELANDSLAVPGAKPVVSSKLPLLESFRFAGHANRIELENAFSRSSLVSCHSYYRHHSLLVNQLSRKYKTPYWFVPHGILDPWVRETGALVKSAYDKLGGKRFIEEAATIVFSTRSERDKASQNYNFKASQVVPWPVELIDCSDAYTSRKKVRVQLGIPDDAPVLLYFGRLHSMKRPLQTIEAFAESGLKDAHLIMVGNVQDVTIEQCMEKAIQLNVANRVHCTGPIYGAQKYDFLHAADAYISLSYRENFNHTAAESMSAGLPVILSRGNDLLSEIGEFNCSVGVADESLEGEAQSIFELISKSPRQRAQMGLNGRAYVASELTFDIFKQRLNAIADKYSRSNT
jgi:glycosyltransferase involved in cell wall biosynthesis